MPSRGPVSNGRSDYCYVMLRSGKGGSPHRGGFLARARVCLDIFFPLLTCACHLNRQSICAPIILMLGVDFKVVLIVLTVAAMLNFSGCARDG